MPSEPEPAPALSAPDLAALGEAKTLLREAVRTRRAARPAAVRAEHDRARTAQALGFVADRAGPGLTVACYLSRDVEPDTLELIAALHAIGARVLLPVLGRRRDGTRPMRDGRRIPDWARYAGPDHLHEGYRGIVEPTTAALGPDALAEAEVVLCAGLAATRTGERLGTGGGWYDRALAYAPEAVSGVLLNDDEVLPQLPIQPWDRKVDVLITPTMVHSTWTGS